MTDSRSNRLPWPLALALVLLVLLTGCGLRILALGEPLWLDELHTAWCVQDSINEVAHRARQGNQSPLFFWLDYVSFQSIQQSVVGLRMPSLLASCALLLSIPVIIFRLSGSVVGAMVGLFLAAFDDQFLFYAVEARPYAMVQLVAVWQIWFFIRGWFATGVELKSIGRRSRLHSLLLSVLLFYLHYTAILLVLTEIAALLVSKSLHRKSATQINWHRLLVYVFALGGMCLPGLWSLATIGQHRQDWNGMVQADHFALLVMALLIVYVLPALLFSLCSKNGFGIDRDVSRVLFVLFGLSLIPVAFCFVGSLTGNVPLGHYRFTISSLTAMVVGVGVLFRFIDPGTKTVAAATLMCVLAILTNPLTWAAFPDGNLPMQRNEAWQTVSAKILEQKRTVLLYPNLVEDQRSSLISSQDYYAFPLRAGMKLVDRENEPPLILTSRLVNGVAMIPAELRTKLLAESEFWLVLRASHDDAASICRALCVSLESASPENRYSLTRNAAGPVNLFLIKRTNVVRDQP